MTFRTARPDATYTALYVGLCAVMLAIGLGIFSSEGDILPLMLLMSIAGMIMSPLIIPAFRPVIVLEERQLSVKQFFNLYRVSITDITKIRKGETLWSGVYKFGNRTGGLTVFAKHKNDLYITPENEQLFLQTITAMNPEVAVEDVSK